MSYVYQPLINLLTIGGPVVAILVGMSVVVVALLLLKLWQFHTAGLFSERRRRRAESVVSAWQAGDSDTAISTAKGGRDPQSKMLSSTATRLQEASLRGRELNEELSREANARLAPLRSQLRTIELIAGLAPLLGLLGTVLGMIEAFQAMELAGSQVDPATLSGGIWQALLTTAVGLVVAIPAMVIHNALERRVESYADGINDSVGRMLTATRSVGLTAVSASSAAAITSLELARARG